MKSKLQCALVLIPFIPFFFSQTVGETYTSQDMLENPEEKENAHMDGN